MPAGPLSPVVRVLLAALTGTEEELLALLDGPGPDWEALLTLAERNRVLAPLASGLLRPSVERQLPERPRERLRAASRSIAQRISAAEVQVQELGEILVQAGVDAVLYKGIGFHLRYCTGAPVRAPRDIDLLVHGSALDDAHTALIGGGYRAVDSRSLAHHRRFHTAPAYRRPGHTLPVDLQWSLASPYGDLARFAPEVFERAVSCRELDGGFRVPEDADALLVAAHGIADRLSLAAALRTAPARRSCVIECGELHRPLELTRWFASSGAAAGQLAIERASALGAARGLRAALRLASDLIPGGAPEWAEESLAAADDAAPWWARISHADLEASEPRTGFRAGLRALARQRLPLVGLRPASLAGPFVRTGFAAPRGAGLRRACRRIALKWSRARASAGE